MCAALSAASRCWSTVARWSRTILLYIYRAQRIFPGAGYRRDPGRFRSAAERFLSPPWRSASRHLADVILQGSGGREPVILHRRSMAPTPPQQRPHSDQPEAARSSASISATDVIRRLQPKLAKVDGYQLFMQPVQDLTVEDRVSRTQFQYSLEDADAKELALLGAAFHGQTKADARIARRRQRPAESGPASRL